MRGQAARRGDHLAAPDLVRRTPRSSSAALSPASARSIVLPNVSTPVTTEATVAPSPMTSTASPDRTWPRSTAPVTTVPRPVMVSTFSTGMRNGALT